MLRASLIFLVLLFSNHGHVLNAQDNWYKGNLHTHSLWSDGDDFPEMIMDWYKSHGYHFVSLSDHNTLAEGDKWLEISEESKQYEVFKKYHQKYGKPWVEFLENKENALVKLKTYNQYRTLFEETDSFLILQAEEISDQYDGKPIHLNATNLKEYIPPQGGDGIADVMQNNINAVNEQRKRTGQPMFPHINHPNFHWAIEADDIKKLNGERFFEVYNGHPAVNNEGNNERSGTEEMWDDILVHYLRNGKPPIYGLAVDDCHNYHKQSSKNSNPGRGWVMVNAESLTANAIIDALEKGKFYGSSGVMLKKLKTSTKKIRIQIDVEEGVAYETQFIGARKEGGVEVLSTVRGAKATYKIKGDELYVRALITSTKLKKNPYKEGEYEKAWIQPVVVD